MERTSYDEPRGVPPRGSAAEAARDVPHGSSGRRRCDLLPRTAGPGGRDSRYAPRMPTRILVALALGVALVILVAWYASRSHPAPDADAWPPRAAPSDGGTSRSR